MGPQAVKYVCLSFTLGVSVRVFLDAISLNSTLSKADCPL